MNEIKEIYGWSNVPEGWFTKTQLKEKGLKPKSKEDAVGTIYVKSRKEIGLYYIGVVPAKLSLPAIRNKVKYAKYFLFLIAFL
jgi:hypothetical protein